MSREIKFRAWDYTSDLMRTDISGIRYNEDGSINQIDVYSGSDILFPDKECALMQYTGLKDKNGVEIYEGDILEYATENFSKAAVVAFDKGRFGLKDYYEELEAGGSVSVEFPHNDYLPLLFPDHLEVIGNIYENSELLK